MLEFTSSLLFSGLRAGNFLSAFLKELDNARSPQGREVEAGAKRWGLCGSGRAEGVRLQEMPTVREQTVDREIHADRDGGEYFELKTWKAYECLVFLQAKWKKLDATK